MIALSACFGLGYAALLVATAAYVWHARLLLFPPDSISTSAARRYHWIGRVLATTSTILFWEAWFLRASRGHGWPIVSPADAAAGIGSTLLLWHVLFPLLFNEDKSEAITTVISLALLTYALVGFPKGPVTDQLASPSSALSEGLNLCAGSLLALAAATSVSHIIYSPRTKNGTSAAPAPGHREGDSQSETLVRVALVCLAIGLAIDTWWLQEIGLGNENDAQQAGIAIAWMIYFVALRLRTNSRWRGWPWAAVITAGFLCTLPILLDVSWLDASISL